jgi:hypothetical protein
MSDAPFSFTIAEVADAGRLAVKRITRHRDGSVSKSHYDNVYLWRFEPAECGLLEAMAARLQLLATASRRCLVMGAPIDGLDLTRPHRRLWAESKVATLRAVNRSWIPLDCDDVIVPAGLGRGNRLVDAALYVRECVLPPEFRGVHMIAIPSASTGLQGDGVARLKLFVLLDRAWPLDTMKAWALGAKVCDALPLDSAPIQAGQPIYTGRPIFIGMTDPVPVHCRAVVLPGSADTVSLVIDRYAAKATKIHARVKFAATACRGNWKQLLALTVGSESGYFEPLTRGIGAAVRTGASPSEIEGFVIALMRLRADPARIQQYNAAWISRSIQSFRRRDAAARAAMLAEFPQEA